MNSNMWAVDRMCRHDGTMLDKLHITLTTNHCRQILPESDREVRGHEQHNKKG